MSESLGLIFPALSFDSSSKDASSPPPQQLKRQPATNNTSQQRTRLILTCTLAAITFAQAEIPIDNNQPPTPSSTKERFAPPFTGGKPGDLLSQKEIGTEIKGARAWKVRYVSKDINDVVTEFTGLVIAPKEKGPDRKVMTWCHGTTGLGDSACPSAEPNPARNLITYFDADSTQQNDYGVPGLQGWIDDGYVVCATDYQGLGTAGQHQYMVNRTQARDAVYLVHDARKLEDVNAGSQFAGVSWSQGGGSSTAVAELDPADCGDLKLVGTVCMSPVVGEIAVNAPMGPSAALSDAKIPPDSHIVMMLAGTQIANYETLKLSDYFTPLGVQILETAWNIQPVHHLNDTIARLFRLKGPVLQSKPANADKWQEAVKAGSAATRKPVAPVLLCMDTFAGGTGSPVPWQKACAEKVKDFGGSIEIKEYPNDDHFSLPNNCAPDARQWLNGLF